MDTVQIQCGSCNKLMAISTAHLGGQVRCPHCQAVVQAPPLSPAAASAPTEIIPPRIESRETESIFSPPEPSDDLFDAGPQRPLVEMPPEIAPPSPPANHGATVEAQAPPRQEDVTELLPAPQLDRHTVPSDEPAHADLATMQRPRPTADRGYWSLMLLIFFVPYSILMTIFVIYLWNEVAKQQNPLRLLPDPAPKNGGARQVLRPKHDQPLAADQKVRLGGDISIGALQVTPQKVTRDETTGDLQLVLSVKNVSTNQAFSPMHQDFLQTPKGSKTTALPYTFLESRTYQPLYGGRVEFERAGTADKLTNEGDLRPGQEEKVIVTAPHNEAVVNKIVASNENLTWRVQLRRGLVHVDGRDVSATAVIGVVFSASEIR